MDKDKFLHYLDVVLSRYMEVGIDIDHLAVKAIIDIKASVQAGVFDKGRG